MIIIIFGVIFVLGVGFLIGFLLRGRELTKLKLEKTFLEAENNRLKEYPKLIEDKFKSLALDVLNQNSKNFAELALQSLKAVEAETKGVLGEKGSEISLKINQLKEAIEKFDKNVKDIEIKRETAYDSLGKGQENLNKTTSELLKALKLSKGSGNWGEIQLKRMAEISGMVEHCDFEIQVLAVEQGDRYYADMVVHLPENRKIIIDAKTPLSAFLKSLEETQSKDVLLKEFIINVYNHFKRLGEKEYYKKYEGSVDFVVMFIPSEAMFSTIVEISPSFIEDCIKSNVIPASPITLIALLKSVAYSWRQSEIESEVKKIKEKARGIYEGLCSLKEHIEKLGKNLTNCVQSYNQFVGSVERNIFPKGRELQNLNPQKSLDEIRMLEEPIRGLNSPDWGKNGGDKI